LKPHLAKPIPLLFDVRPVLKLVKTTHNDIFGFPLSTIELEEIAKEMVGATQQPSGWFLTAASTAPALIFDTVAFLERKFDTLVTLSRSSGEEIGQQPRLPYNLIWPLIACRCLVMPPQQPTPAESSIGLNVEPPVVWNHFII